MFCFILLMLKVSLLQWKAMNWIQQKQKVNRPQSSKEWVQIPKSPLSMEWYRLHLIFPETMSDSMYWVIAHEESSPRPWCPVFLLLWGLSCGHGELMRLILVTSDYIPFRIQTDLLMPRSLTINHTVNINHLVVYLVDLHIYKNIFIRQDILRA